MAKVVTRKHLEEIANLSGSLLADTCGLIGEVKGLTTQQVATMLLSEAAKSVGLVKPIKQVTYEWLLDELKASCERTIELINKHTK